jgi:hypothetical protein
MAKSRFAEYLSNDLVKNQVLHNWDKLDDVSRILDSHADCRFHTTDPKLGGFDNDYVLYNDQLYYINEPQHISQKIDLTQEQLDTLNNYLMENQIKDRSLLLDDQLKKISEITNHAHVVVPNYHASDELINLISLYAKNNHEDSWLTIALAIAMNDLFTPEGEVLPDIRKQLVMISPFLDNQIKYCLLKAYFTTYFIVPIADLCAQDNNQDYLMFFKEAGTFINSITPENLNANLNAIMPIYTPERTNELIEEEKTYTPNPDIQPKRKNLSIEDEEVPWAVPTQPEQKTEPASNEVAKETKPGFFARNWQNFLMGFGTTLVIAGMVALGIATLGIAPAIITIVALVAIGTGALASFTGALGSAVNQPKDAPASPATTGSSTKNITKVTAEPAIEPQSKAKAIPNMDDPTSTLRERSTSASPAIRQPTEILLMGKRPKPPSSDTPEEIKSPPGAKHGSKEKED